MPRAPGRPAAQTPRNRRPIPAEPRDGWARGASPSLGAAAGPGMQSRAAQMSRRGACANAALTAPRPPSWCPQLQGLLPLDPLPLQDPQQRRRAAHGNGRLPLRDSRVPAGARCCPPAPRPPALRCEPFHHARRPRTRRCCTRCTPRRSAGSGPSATCCRWAPGCPARCRVGRLAAIADSPPPPLADPVHQHQEDQGGGALHRHAQVRCRLTRAASAPAQARASHMLNGGGPAPAPQGAGRAQEALPVRWRDGAVLHQPGPQPIRQRRPVPVHRCGMWCPRSPRRGCGRRAAVHIDRP
jgi:hypothetical protein